jgi:uncharacterized protein
MIETIHVAPEYFALIMLIAFASSVVGGISGFGAGLIIVPMLLPIVGVKGVIPVVGVAMVVGNLARVYVYRQDIQFRLVARMLVAILPGAAIGVWLYAVLPAQVVALVIGCILILSVPVRRILQRYAVTPSPGSVSVIAFLCGVLAGNAPGGGVIIVTLLLGMGLSGPVLLGVDAVIGVALSLTNSVLFGTFGLLNLQLALIGLGVGAAMIPGAFVARALIGRITSDIHVRIIEVFVIFGGLSFFYAALASHAR